MQNLTEQEKIDFLIKLKEKQSLGWLIKDKSTWLVIFSCVSLISMFTAATLFAQSYLISGILLTILGATPIVANTSIRTMENKMLNEISNGKIDKKTFKMLQKSGELEKWQEQYKTQIEKGYLKNKNIEITEYLADEIQDIIEVTMLTNPEAKVDAEEINKKIKETIEKNNTKEK